MIARLCVVAQIKVASQPFGFVSLDAPNRYAVRNTWGRNLGPYLTRDGLLAYLRDIQAHAPSVEVSKCWASHPSVKKFCKRCNANTSWQNGRCLDGDHGNLIAAHGAVGAP